MNTFLDLKEMVPKKTSIGRIIVTEINSDTIAMQIPSSHIFSGGKESKKVVLNRFVNLDELFLEGLGLWRGEGSKKKGIYFGNTEPAILNRFLDFVENRLGISRKNFKVTINLPFLDDQENSGILWSERINVPIENFTKICVDPRINLEYAQVYFNSVILAELMGVLYLHIKTIVSKDMQVCIPFLRGLFAAEGSVLLKKSGVLHHITFSSKDDELIQLICESLRLVGVIPSAYMENGMNLQIYGHKNFEQILKLGIHTLHPDKREKFERGFAAFKRIGVLDGEEARARILHQLAFGPKTYDELAEALGKARTTIQAHHIPILEKRGLIKRAGRRGSAWLFDLSEPPIVIRFGFEKSAAAQTL